jgi:homocysteine S-methyltransferase
MPLFANIRLLTSLRNVEFMKNDLRFSMPGQILLRMDRAGSPAAARRESIRIAQEMLESMRPFARGVQVSAPLGRHYAAAEVIASVLPKPA